MSASRFDLFRNLAAPPHPAARNSLTPRKLPATEHRELHHSKHHQTYVTNLNKVRPVPSLACVGLVEGDD